MRQRISPHLHGEGYPLPQIPHKNTPRGGGAVGLKSLLIFFVGGGTEIFRRFAVSAFVAVFPFVFRGEAHLVRPFPSGQVFVGENHGQYVYPQLFDEPFFVLFERAEDGHDGHVELDGVGEHALFHGAGLLIVYPHCPFGVEVDNLPLFKQPFHLAYQIFRRRVIRAERQHSPVANDVSAESALVVPLGHRVEGAEVAHRLPHKQRVEEVYVIAHAERAFALYGFKIFPARDARAEPHFEQYRRKELQKHPPEAVDYRFGEFFSVRETFVGHFPIFARGYVFEVKPSVTFKRRLNFFVFFLRCAFARTLFCHDIILANAAAYVNKLYARPRKVASIVEKSVILRY